jgi:hypothetical protein
VALFLASRARHTDMAIATTTEMSPPEAAMIPPVSKMRGA